MNLYLISQNINNGYDTYDTALVAANNEEEARLISPDGYLEWSEEKDSWAYPDGDKRATNNGAWVKPSKVSVELIGIASPDTEAGHIFSSFNAG